MKTWGFVLGMLSAWVALASSAAAAGTRDTPLYKRVKAHLDSVPAIDTHDHLPPFDKLPGYLETDQGKGMNLASLWLNSYLGSLHRLTPWKPGQKFDPWWANARNDFDNLRGTSFYRYQLPAFKDLYGIDFDRITDDQARDLNVRIYRNYLDQRWLYEVITEKANIELMLNDPWWGRYDLKTDYPFAVLVLNVTFLINGFHPSEFTKASDDPYHFAKERGLKIDTLADYLALLDRLYAEAKQKGAVCLKTTIAYRRTLHFENVPLEKAAKVFGRPREQLTEQEIKDFQDFIMWRLVELSGKHELPFQIHTGWGKLQGSSPMNLLDMIENSPKTKFILFHGGFPWTSESGAIAMRFHNRVWLDSCWLPTLSYSMAKRAYHEWLEMVPSNKIMWGGDCNHAEGIYGATEFTRSCLAEVLAEKIERGDLTEEHALRIGRQIMRDNALELFPQLKDRLWKRKGKLTPPVK